MTEDLSINNFPFWNLKASHSLHFASQTFVCVYFIAQSQLIRSSKAIRVGRSIYAVFVQTLQFKSSFWVKFGRASVFDARGFREISRLKINASDIFRTSYAGGRSCAFRLAFNLYISLMEMPVEQVTLHWRRKHQKVRIVKRKYCLT